MARPSAALTIVLTCSALACARAAPAGFWKNFRSNLIVASHSDQGPWGGTRWIHWTASEADAVFTMDDVAAYVWTYDGKPVFPFDFEPPILDLARGEFPRHIVDDTLLVRCDSGWMRTLGPTGGDETAYGHILFEKSGRRLAIYHLWGEL